MHKQLKYLINLLSKKVVLLFVLFSSVILLFSSLYHFVSQNNLLEKQFDNHLHLIEQKETYDNLNFSIDLAEAAINGYALSGNKKFIANYYPVLNSIPHLYSNFKALQSANTSLTDGHLFLEYNQLVVKRIATMQQVQQLSITNQYILANAIIIANEDSTIASGIIKNNSIILQMAIQKSHNSFLAANNQHNGFAYICFGISMVLKLGIFYFLIKIARDRKLINTELRLQKEYFLITINSIAEGLISTDKLGNILFMNTAAEKLTGWQKLDAENCPLEKVYKIVNEESGLAFENIVSRILKNGQTIDFENNTILYTKNNIPLIISNSGSPIFDAKGNISGTVLVFNDISERKIAEKNIKKAIERYDILAKATSDTIWDWDIINNTILYNASITSVFGYKIAQVENVVAWWQEKVHPDDLQTVVAAINEVNKNKAETLYLEYRFRCADGSYKYIYDRAFVIYDEQNKPARMIGAMQDMSYEKAEEKRIAKATIDAQEKERHHIGQELHDNVNQILVGSLLTLGLAKEKKNDPVKQSEFLETSRQHIITAIDEVRKLSHQLAPASFDDRSLKQIFEDLLAIVNINSKYNINLLFNDISDQAISGDIQINLFRILQEQLKNILKYADATAIDISINVSNNIVKLRIFDNGKGFNAKLEKKGIGLNNIKKRAEAFSGKFSLNTNIGKGCEVIVEIPIG